MMRHHCRATDAAGDAYPPHCATAEPEPRLAFRYRLGRGYPFPAPSGAVHAVRTAPAAPTKTGKHPEMRARGNRQVAGNSMGVPFAERRQLRLGSGIEACRVSRVVGIAAEIACRGCLTRPAHRGAGACRSRVFAGSPGEALDQLRIPASSDSAVESLSERLASATLAHDVADRRRRAIKVRAMLASVSPASYRAMIGANPIAGFSLSYSIFPYQRP